MPRSRCEREQPTSERLQAAAPLRPGADSSEPAPLRAEVAWLPPARSFPNLPRLGLGVVSRASVPSTPRLRRHYPNTRCQYPDRPKSGSQAVSLVLARRGLTAYPGAGCPASPASGRLDHRPGPRPAPIALKSVSRHPSRFPSVPLTRERLTGRQYLMIFWRSGPSDQRSIKRAPCLQPPASSESGGLATIRDERESR